jgi:hypothetical protein
MNYMEYYDRYEILKNKDFVLNLSLLNGIFMGFLAIFHLLASFSCLSLFFSQIYSTISEYTYYERTKNHNVENQYCIINTDNLKKDVINFYINLIIFKLF